MVPAPAPPSPLLTLRVGAEVDRYTVIRLLGIGGMAEVWEVEHRVLQTRHALKVLRAADPGLAARLVAEGRAQAALDHPHLLPVRDTVDLGGAIGLVLPLVDGPALDVLLRAYRPTAAEALALYAAVVQGVAAIHAQGWVHRDLKPGNVLLDLRQGRVTPRVSDFGLIKASHTETAGHGVFFGTPAYAAPEQLRDAAGVDARADLWSLGVLLVELLTGHKPFPSGTLAELQAAHRQGPALGELAPPPAHLARTLLSPDPETRPASAAALAETLAPLLDPGDPLGTGGALYAAANDLRRPEEIGERNTTFATGDADSLAAPPPRDNLPPRRDRFLGRQAEQAALDGLLAGSTRLITVLGAGGAGKTRLVTEWASASRARWPGGVWFCDLTEARDGLGVLAAVARALEVPLAQRDPTTGLGHALRARGSALVVLDNAEQVAAETAQILATWLDQGLAALFVVTSRAVLGLPDEQLLEVGPLDLPDRRATSPAIVQAASAGALLVARAQEAVPGWTLRAPDVSAATELLGLLDGLPLAIELAASRLRVMGLPALRDRMADRFKLLAAPGRGQDRQATMRAVLDWSWNLLSPPEQAALAQVSVFEGGFTLDAAEAVIALAPQDPWVVDVLQLLLDRSLLRQVGPTDEEPRFGLYVSVRDYAAERLRERDAAGAEARHGAWFARCGAQEALDGLVGLGGRRRAQALLLELDNLMVACRRAVDRGDAAVATSTLVAAGELLPRVGAAQVGGEALATRVVGLARASGSAALRSAACQRAALTLYWLGRPSDALALVDEGLGVAQGDLRRQAQLAGHRGVMLFDLGRPAEARAQLEEAERLARQVGDQTALARALRSRGLLAAQIGDTAQAHRHYAAALQIHERAADTAGEAYMRWFIGTQYMQDGQPEEAAPHLEAALRLSKEESNRDGLCRAHNQLAILARERGQLDLAARHIQAALTNAREQGNQRLEALVLADQGDILAGQGRLQEACAVHEAALALCRAQGRRRTAAMVLYNLGCCHLELRDYSNAEAELTEARDLAHAAGHWQAEGAALRELGRMAGLRGAVDQARSLLAQSEDLLTAHHDTPQQAQTLLARAEVERRLGDVAAARGALAEAERLAAALLATPHSTLGRALDAARRELA